MSQYFIYTRTRDIDYRTVVSPSDDFCPKETRKKFLKEIRGVIDVETYDDPINSPRWLYSKCDDMILFGVAVMNGMLSKEYSIDFIGRPVRGFFGIIANCTDTPVLLPFDLDFYKFAYNHLIEPIWNLNRDEYKQSSVIVDYCKTTCKMIENKDSNIVLNCNNNICTILGDVNSELAFQTALNSMQDTRF